MFTKKHSISFVHAWNGIVHTFKTQPNMRFHAIATLIVLGVSFILQISRFELLLVLFAMMLVWVAEMVNTAIESMTDLITIKYSQHAKEAKDVAAGMVLVAAIWSAILGIVIFLPYIKELL